MFVRIFPAVFFDGDDGGGSGAPNGGEQPQTFTQEQVNSFLAKERRNTETELEALRARAKVADDLEAAGKTELERATAERDAAAKRAEEAEKAAADGAVQVSKLLTRSAFVAEAARQGAVDPDAAFAIASDGGALTSITVGEDGAVSGVAETVKGVLDTRTYLTGSPGSSRPSLDGGARLTPPASADQQVSDAQGKGDFQQAGRIKAAQLAQGLTG